MREAFSNVASKTVVKRDFEKQKFNLREFIWNYPDNISDFFKKTSPLSAIFLFIIIGTGIFTFLTSDLLAQNLYSQKYFQYAEGHVGAISTLNPLFSNQNDIDKAIQELVFEKFIYIDSNGDVQPGIATNWKVSDNGRIYEFDISLDHTWSDGQPLTIDDIYFTYNTALQLSEKQGYDTIGTPLADVDIEIVDIDTIKFTLPESNATFFEIVSAYIVPKHILEEVSLSDMPFNIFAKNPTGSGAYRIYRSEPNIVYMEASEYYSPTPKISNLIIRVYSDISKLESAFRNGVLDGAVVPNSEDVSFFNEYSSFNIDEIDLPYRERVLFFNIRKEKFQSEELRRGIGYLIDKNTILNNSGIIGNIQDGPIYQGSWAYSVQDYVTYNREKGVSALKSAGYTVNDQNGYFQTEDGKILTLSLSYLDNDSNNRLMDSLKDQLDNEGIIINLEPFSYSSLTQEILATRNFEILMYEIELSIDPDQYNLWHSLQKEYPNLNLSGYEYERVDILLEEARSQLDRNDRKDNYALFQRYIAQNVPAVFLFRPTYLFVTRDNLQGIEYVNIARLEDIYKGVYNWEFVR